MGVQRHGCPRLVPVATSHTLHWSCILNELNCCCDRTQPHTTHHTHTCTYFTITKHMLPQLVAFYSTFSWSSLKHHSTPTPHPHFLQHTDTGLSQLSTTASASSVYGTLPRKKGAANSSAPKSGLPPLRANGSGGLDEMDFQRAFDDTPTVQVSLCGVRIPVMGQCEHCKGHGLHKVRCLVERSERSIYVQACVVL